MTPRDSPRPAAPQDEPHGGAREDAPQARKVGADVVLVEVRRGRVHPHVVVLWCVLVVGSG